MGIYVASFNDLKNCSFAFIDEVWVIVRSLKGGLPIIYNEDGTVDTTVDVFHVPQLSPSTDLFHKYLDLKKDGNWNEETFQKEYVPRFLHEMHGKEQKNFLNILYSRAKNNNILLVCYCTEEILCHRSIVLGIMQGCFAERGERIRCEGEDFTLDDYSEYYEMYKKAGNKFTYNIQENEIRKEKNFYLIIAGTRTFDNYEFLKNEVDKVLVNQITKGKNIVIIEGEARGADTLARQYAEEKGYEVKKFPANWDKLGKSAGYQRNENMHLYAASPTGNNSRGCICFWDGKSKGTKHNFMLAGDYKNPIRVFNYVEGKYYTQDKIQELAEEVRKEQRKYNRY